MSSIVNELEHLIRTNRVQEAHERINALSFADVPRAQAAKMANLALRAGALFWAVRLLNPLVRNDSSGIPASDEEKLEYSFALIRIGAHSEAKRILGSLEKKNLPRVYMYLAAIHANAWDYRAAIECFKTYLEFPQLSEYEKLVGRLNLAGAMVGGDVDFHEAEKALLQLRTELSDQPNKLLYGNSLEISAQLFVKRGQYSVAEEFIQKGLEIFPEVDSPSALFFQKWHAILKLRRGDADARTALDKVRCHAVRIQHHESIREVDFYRAIDGQDEELFNRVYFGTPWRKYRERLLKNKPAHVTLHSVYEYYGDREVNKSAPIVSVNRFGVQVSGKNSELKTGQVLHRAFVGLVSDLYRPVWVAALHDHLFPDEFFHPESGPKRVHQAMFRLRNWFVESEIPLDVNENNGRYSLTWKDSCCIKMELEKQALQGPAAICEKLVQHFRTMEFATGEAAEILKVSPTHTRDALRWGVANGLLDKIGSGPKTRYKKAS